MSARSAARVVLLTAALAAAPSLVAPLPRAGGAAPLAAQAVEPHEAEGRLFRSSLHDVRLVTVASGLVNPFSMAFTPEGDLLVTERPGRLRIVRDGVLLPDAVEGLPDILALGNGAKAMMKRMAKSLSNTAFMKEDHPFSGRSNTASNGSSPSPG